VVCTVNSQGGDSKILKPATALKSRFMNAIGMVKKGPAMRLEYIQVPWLKITSSISGGMVGSVMASIRSCLSASLSGGFELKVKVPAMPI
jgi:hypothetical protein